MCTFKVCGLLPWLLFPFLLTSAHTKSYFHREKWDVDQNFNKGTEISPHILLTSTHEYTFSYLHREKWDVDQNFNKGTQRSVHIFSSHQLIHILLSSLGEKKMLIKTLSRAWSVHVYHSVNVAEEFQGGFLFYSMVMFLIFNFRKKNTVLGLNLSENHNNGNFRAGIME